MTDLAVLAIGLGVIPLAAILLYSFRGFVLTRREAVWGFLAGVLAFLALGHAMAAVLVNKSLFGDTAIAIAVAFVGLAVGAGIAWLVLEGPFIEKEPNRILWVAVARSEEHTSELQSQSNLVCRLLLEKKNHPADVLVFGRRTEMRRYDADDDTDVGGVAEL